MLYFCYFRWMLKSVEIENHRNILELHQKRFERVEFKEQLPMYPWKTRVKNLFGL